MPRARTARASADHAEEGEAADEQPVEPHPPPRADVDGDRRRHEEEERQVRERQERGLEPAEEEGVSGHLPDEVGRDHQEEIGEEQQPAGEIAALEAEEAFEGTGHGETGALEQTLPAVYTPLTRFPKGRSHEESPAGRGGLARRAAAPRAGAGPAAPAAAPRRGRARAAIGSKVWIGRYAEFEEFLRTAPIER